MSSLVLTGSTSGSVSVQAPAVAGSNTATIGAATGTHYPFTAGTAVASTSGTSIDFTGIPSWVKRITVMFGGVSGNGTSNFLVQLGTSSGVVTTGYSSRAATQNVQSSSTAGFIVTYSVAAADTSAGAICLNLLGSNLWTSVGNLSGNNNVHVSAGNVTLAATLDRVRITTVNGTDTFDAGSINIFYE